MKKIFFIIAIGFLFTACNQKSKEVTLSEDVSVVVDTSLAVPNTPPDTLSNVPPPPYHAGKLAATATDEVVGKDGKTVSFTYDNNASTVAFDLNGKHIVLASKEKVSDVPMPDGRTYSNEEFTFNDKDGIKITDKAGKTVFEEK